MISLGPLAVAFAVFVAAIGVVLILWWGGATDRKRHRAISERTPFSGGRAPRVHA